MSEDNKNMEFYAEQLEEQLYHLMEEVADLGPKWAELQGEVTNLEDRKYDYLAKLTFQAPGESNTEKERNARLTPEWEVWRRTVRKQKKECLLLKIKYDVAIKKWETYRSLLSSK